MHLKSFTIGAVCGALLWAGGSALWIRQPSSADQHNAQQVASDDQRTPIQGMNAELPTAKPPHVLRQTQANNEPSQLRERDAASSPEPNEIVSPQASDGLAEADATADRESTEDKWFANFRSKLNKEPRDNSWSYFTEQAILLFLSEHPSMKDFTLKFIECRSNTCQIGIEGYGEVTGPTWQRIMYDMRQQAWFDFAQSGTASNVVNGRFLVIADLRKSIQE
jgi:hypothetical protein